MTTKPSEFDNSAAVNAYLTTLDHPLKPLLEAIRHSILAADGGITEGIKWNSASFYCHGWFATANVRAKDKILLVLHQGAKAQAASTLRQTMDDSSRLLTWLAPDRATVTFTSLEDFQEKQAAFGTIIQQWVAYQLHLTQNA